MNEKNRTFNVAQALHVFHVRRARLRIAKQYQGKPERRCTYKLHAVRKRKDTATLKSNDRKVIFRTFAVVRQKPPHDMWR